MTPLPTNPNAVILVDTENKIVATASNISEDFIVKVVTERSAFVAEAANKPFDSTRPPQPVQVLSSAASKARYAAKP